MIVDMTLERAHELLDRYSELFQAVTYAPSMVGADDYQYVLRSIRDSMTESKRKVDEEVAKYGEKSP